jgi:6-phosphogluconate dehydrogenase
MTEDGDVFIFNINNLKVKSLNGLSTWRIKYNIYFGIMIECGKYRKKNIEDNIKKIFFDVIEKENIIIDDNNTIYDDKPYIALLKKITDL